MTLPPDHVPAWVDKARLCVETCLHENTVDAWVRMGLLPPGRKRAGKLLWKWIEVEEYLERGGRDAESSLNPDADKVAAATQRALARRGK